MDKKTLRGNKIMTIKIYNVIGMGLVMGEKIRQDNEKIYLGYPGIVVPNQQTKDGIRNTKRDSPHHHSNI